MPATGRGAEGRGRSCTVTRRRTPDHSAVMCTNSSACIPECLVLVPTSSEVSNLASSNSSGGIARAPRDRRTSARDSGLARTLRSSRHLGPASGETSFTPIIMVYPSDELSTPATIPTGESRGPSSSRLEDGTRFGCGAGPGEGGDGAGGVGAGPGSGVGSGRSDRANIAAGNEIVRMRILPWSADGRFNVRTPSAVELHIAPVAIHQVPSERSTAFASLVTT